MKNSKHTEFFRPFENLKILLKDRSFDPPCPTLKPSSKNDFPLKPDEEKLLFEDAMAGVQPITGKRRIVKKIKTKPDSDAETGSDSEILKHLHNLIRCGDGFVVADTPEYMEGNAANAHPEITKRLHRGDFSIQGHIDLHGHSVREAREALEIFLKDAIQTGKRGVLIIHGRGLSSRKEPVLKTRLYEWLTRGPWRKWVIAFSSARLEDGGAGATYLLLRQHPRTKRYRKKD